MIYMKIPDKKLTSTIKRIGGVPPPPHLPHLEGT